MIYESTLTDCLWLQWPEVARRATQRLVLGKITSSPLVARRRPRGTCRYRWRGARRLCSTGLAHSCRRAARTVASEPSGSRACLHQLAIGVTGWQAYRPRWWWGGRRLSAGDAARPYRLAGGALPAGLSPATRGQADFRQRRSAGRCPAVSAAQVLFANFSLAATVSSPISLAEMRCTGSSPAATCLAARRQRQGAAAGVRR